MTKTTKAVLAIFVLVFIAWGINATKNVDSETGKPVHTVAVKQDAPVQYKGDPYTLTECGGDAEYACPSDIPEDAPLWWCLTDGNAECGPSVKVVSRSGVTCIMYDNGPVCQDEKGYRWSVLPLDSTPDDTSD